MCVFFTFLMFAYSWVRNLGMLFFIARIKKVNKMSIKRCVTATFLALKRENKEKLDFEYFGKLDVKIFTLKPLSVVPKWRHNVYVPVFIMDKSPKQEVAE